jgi:archaellum component FlaG (FlaF/FlaG flagellin family)
MSKPSKRPSTSPKPPATQTGRPGWLAAVFVALAGIALVSMLVWLVQRSAAEIIQAAPTQDARSGATAAQGPRISVDQEQIDYGDVKLNTTIETAIRVKNIGEQALALDQNPVVELVEGC